MEFAADEETKVSSSSGRGEKTIPAYEPPRAYVPPGAHLDPPKRRAWPWVVGILGLLLLILVGMGIAAAIFIPRMLEQAANQNSRANSNSNRSERSNSNRTTSNSNTNLSANSNTSAEPSESAPTDAALVLAQLTEIENEWTVANINADKKALDRILADDYVGEGVNGKSQGKAEYLNTIERDATIQKWEFESLKVDLKGERASLSGIINLQLRDRNVSYQFTDKFVWRDGRWQAVGSEVSEIKQSKAQSPRSNVLV
jgi:hypothetical protein